MNKRNPLCIKISVKTLCTNFVNVLFFSIAGVLHASETVSEYDIEEFKWQYLGFIEYIEQENWKAVAKYIDDTSRCGFGGEECIDNVKTGCREEALMWLRMGCVYGGVAHDDPSILTCRVNTDLIQAGEEREVFRANSHFGFEFDTKTKKMSITIFMCGGD